MQKFDNVIKSPLVYIEHASPVAGWPSNKDQCAAELIACQEYLDVHSKPMHCTPCNCLEETTRKPVKQPSSCEELITSGRLLFFS